MYLTTRTNLGIGGLAFLAGVLATIVTAYAMVSIKPKISSLGYNRSEGWDLGV